MYSRPHFCSIVYVPYSLPIFLCQAVALQSHSDLFTTPGVGTAFHPFPLGVTLYACGSVMQKYRWHFIFTGDGDEDLTQTVCTNHNVEIAYHYLQMEA